MGLWNDQCKVLHRKYEWRVILRCFTERSEADWTSKRPDLNPMEMFWSILDKKLAAKPIYSKATLIERFQEEWNNIDKDLCIKLVESMPEPIRKCLKGKGGHFL